MQNSGKVKRTRLDQQLEELETSLLELASRVEKATNRAFLALKSCNHLQAQKVIEEDQPLNDGRYALEQEALALLTLQQPLATRDLRYVVAAIQIASELERMGDYAKGIAKISDKLTGIPPMKALVLLEEMTEQATHMLKAVMEAFVNQDCEAAHRVFGRDEVLDELYQRTQQTLIELMMAEPATIDLLTPLLWAAHNLERIGDRVINICGRINFIQTGHIKDNISLVEGFRV